MRKLNAFLFISLDGFYKDANNSIDWHKHGEEEAKFSEENAKAGHTLVFGRITYEMMHNFWPSPMAYEQYPVVAKHMNESEKIIISNSLEKADWNNSFIIKNGISSMKKIKMQEGKDMTILGSGSIVSQFAEAGIIDSIQIMMDPVAIGNGTSLFKGIHNRLHFELIDVRKFKSGSVVLNYHFMK
jgi:dihydrofolate reductase